MAKAKLGALTQKWIDSNPENHNSVNTEIHKGVNTERRITENEEKVKQTICLSKKVVKLLWHNRAETGEPMSHTIERLVIERLGKDK